jgi:ribosomal protection tetracycline resistance protein
LAEQDPLINLRHDEEAGEIFVSLYGEVQKEVIQSTLALDFGLEVEFLESTVIYVERALGSGEGARRIVPGAGNPFVATVGLRVERAAPCRNGQ